MINKCDLCNKDRKKFEGFVWYSGNSQTDLCKGCYLRWCKSKERRLTELKYKKAKPCTRLWSKKCGELQSKFNKWFKEKKSSEENE